jgi:hypothetical protein
VSVTFASLRICPAGFADRSARGKQLRKIKFPIYPASKNLFETAFPHIR